MQKLLLYRYIWLANLVKNKSLKGLFNFYVVVDILIVFDIGNLR